MSPGATAIAIYLHNQIQSAIGFADMLRRRLAHLTGRTGGAPSAPNTQDVSEHEMEDDDSEEPSRPVYAVPLVTYAMLITIALVFVAMLIAGHGDVSHNSVPARFGAKINELISRGEIWRLITPMFLHGGWPHLLINAYSLYQLGGSLERIYGSRKYLLIYIAAGIAGNYLSYRMTPTPSLGASGAIFGLVGAGLVFPLRYSAYIPRETRSSILRQLAPIAGINLVIGFVLQGMVDNWAHIGGLLGGGFVALFLIPAVLEEEPRPRWKEAALSFMAAAAVGVVLWAGIMQWRSPKQSLLPTMASYSPNEPSPWWSISVPTRWAPTSWGLGNGGWVSPKGATLKVNEIKVLDAPGDPALIAAAQAVVAHLNAQPGAGQGQEKGKNAPESVKLDGKPGWHLVTKRNDRILDAYVIATYDRLFVIVLDCPEAAYPATKSDFALIRDSVRFLHAPNLPKAP